MCLAIPGKVVDVTGASATVEIGGQRSRVNLALLKEGDQPVVGDYLVSHLGMALSRIDEAEALELMVMLREITGNDELVAVE